MKWKIVKKLNLKKKPHWNKPTLDLAFRSGFVPSVILKVLFDHYALSGMVPWQSNGRN